MVSRRRLRTRLPGGPAVVRWALDSGGFTEVTKLGGWGIGATEYVAEVRRYSDRLGAPCWAAPQDWMCEDEALAATGLDVAEHQRRTVANLVELRQLAPDVAWLPVLQGQAVGDYLRCWQLYDAAGVDLHGEPLVGLGSVCRRQASAEVGTIVDRLAMEGLRLHGFGVKSDGLAAYGHTLASADSMAWSNGGRRRPGRCGRPHRCNNCLPWALQWRAGVLAQLDGVQPPLWAP